MTKCVDVPVVPFIHATFLAEEKFSAMSQCEYHKMEQMENSVMARKKLIFSQLKSLQ